MATVKCRPKLTLILALLLASLFTECGFKKQQLEESKEAPDNNGPTPPQLGESKEAPDNNGPTPPPPSVIPITDDIINRARKGNPNITGVDWEFLAKKLEDLKNGVNGAKVNEKNTKNNHCTALQYAAMLGGDTDITKSLVARGADINAQDNLEYTALHMAVWYNNVGVVKELLAKGANREAKNKGDRFTSLHMAAAKGYIEVTQALVDAGANVKAKDKNEFTPLHHAVSKGHTEVIKALLKAGADKEAKSKEGWMPYQLAKNQQIIDLLKK